MQIFVYGNLKRGELGWGFFSGVGEGVGVAYI